METPDVVAWAADTAFDLRNRGGLLSQTAFDITPGTLVRSALF